MHVTVHTAKTQLSKLIEAALSGEEVIIARGSKPVVKLVPLLQNGFQYGLLADRLSSETTPDFFEPLDETTLREWEGS